jgi:uncharacterized membrane protein
MRRFSTISSLLVLFMSAQILVTPAGAQNKPPVTYEFVTLDILFPQDPLVLALTGFNNRGQIVGITGDLDLDNFRAILIEGGSVRDLDLPTPGVVRSQAFDINNSGTIVGDYVDDTGAHGFLLRGGRLTTLDNGAFGINDHNDLVGVRVVEGTQHGYLLSQGEFTTLDVPFAGAVVTFPVDINNHRQIVGSYTTENEVHGFFYERGVFRPLDVPLPGVTNTQPGGINNRGLIVGWYGGEGIGVHGFVYDDGIFTTLDVPSSSSTRVMAVNDRGQILGEFSDRDGTHGFLATPQRAHK